MLLLLLAVCHGMLFGACIAICVLRARAALKVALALAAAFERPRVQNYASRPASDTEECESLRCIRANCRQNIVHACAVYELRQSLGLGVTRITGQDLTAYEAQQSLASYRSYYVAAEERLNVGSQLLAISVCLLLWHKL